MKPILSRIMAGVLTITLIFAGLPLSSAHAAELTRTNTIGAYATPTPPAESSADRAALRALRLERIFARQSQVVEHAGNLYKQADLGFPKIQKRIDKAKEHGLDVTAVQSAFDAFKKALADARPLYEKAKGLVDTHNGFDANGKVTDLTAARETVKSIHETGAQFKEAMNGTYKALKQAVKALRPEK